CRRISILCHRFYRQFLFDVDEYGSEFHSYIERHFEDYVREISNKIKYMCYYFKHSSFHAEDEVRLIYIERDKEDFSKKGFRPSKYCVVPYYSTSEVKGVLEDGSSWGGRKLPIKRVTIGPSPYSDLSK